MVWVLPGHIVGVENAAAVQRRQVEIRPSSEGRAGIPAGFNCM